MKRISIARDFSQTPGARFSRDGEYSGEEFRDTFLVPLFEDTVNIEKILIDLDGVEGYSTAFLEEVFGGLARRYGSDKILSRIDLVSDEDPLLIEEVLSYIKRAE